MIPFKFATKSEAAGKLDDLNDRDARAEAAGGPPIWKPSGGATWSLGELRRGPAPAPHHREEGPHLKGIRPAIDPKHVSAHLYLRKDVEG